MNVAAKQLDFVWRPKFQIGFWMLAIILMVAFLMNLLGPKIIQASAAKNHYCMQFAEQVVAGDVSLDRYMATDCRMMTLAEVEGLTL